MKKRISSIVLSIMLLLALLVPGTAQAASDTADLRIRGRITSIEKTPVRSLHL